MSNSKVIKCTGNYSWNNIPKKVYKDNLDCYEGVHRYSLLGEESNEHALNFHTRYFEVSPGGYTSLEQHRHPHSVIVIRGKGSIVLGNEIYDLALHDVVYVAPETMHQFHADKNEPLGFICIVDRYRDKPQLPSDEQVASVITSGKVGGIIRRPVNSGAGKNGGEIT
jgi:quercetin dioxygenase-like cupin family protein